MASVILQLSLKRSKKAVIQTEPINNLIIMCYTNSTFTHLFYYSVVEIFSKLDGV